MRGEGLTRESRMWRRLSDHAGVARPVQLDFMPTYAAHLRHLIMEGVDHPNSFSQPLKGMKVVVDAGNGSGGFFKSLVSSLPLPPHA